MTIQVRSLLGIIDIDVHNHLERILPRYVVRNALSIEERATTVFRGEGGAGDIRILRTVSALLYRNALERL